MSVSIPDDKLPENYTGNSRYWEAAEDWYDVDLSTEQREICEHVADNQYSHIGGGNGCGKTFAIVSLALAFYHRHYPASVVVTSGTYGKLKRTFCEDAKRLFQASPLSEMGEWKWSPNPHIDDISIGEEKWQFEVLSPGDDEELEGIHNDNTLVIADESDKQEITLQTLDSLDSLITDSNDRMVIVSNPAHDETNSIERLDEIGINPQKLQLSTLRSHNIQVELGERDGDTYPGLIHLDKLQRKWEALNGEDWPGIEKARRWSDPDSDDFRDELSANWFRRYAGIMPPASASANRPFEIEDVKEAHEISVDKTARRRGTGIDVAGRGDDATVQMDERDCVLSVAYQSQSIAEIDQIDKLDEIILNLDAEPEAQISVDYVGDETFAAKLQREYPNVDEWNNGEVAVQDQKYKNRWTEGLVELGEWMKKGGTFSNRKLRNQLMAAAREIELRERYIKSRGTEVLEATSKEMIKDRLGTSPDHLDAAIMAVCAARDLKKTDNDDTNHVKLSLG